MRHLKLLFMLLVSIVGIQHSYGAAQEALGTDNYYCAFKTQDEFDLWTVLMLDTDDDWRTWRYTGDGGICATCNLDRVSDDWLISPMLTLTEGKQHYIKMKVAAGGNGQRIVFTMGKDKTPEAQTEILMDSIFNGNSGYLCIKVPENLSGDYHFAMHYMATAWSSTFTIYSFLLTESEGVDFSGTVTNTKDKIIGDAQVALSGETFRERTVRTDSEGKFSFNSLDPGEYQLKVSADGNIAGEETITIGTTSVDHPVVLEALMEFDIKGCVKSEEGGPVKSAFVTLQGELTYSAQTDENGNFVLEKVREYEGYKLKVEKDLKVTYTAVVNMEGEEIDLGDIVMKTNVLMPYNVKSQEVEAGAILSWMLPLKANEIRYDSGIHYGVYTIANGQEYAIMGVAFDTPALIKGMSWMAVTKTQKVNLFLFAMNQDGSISNRILYSVKDVENIDYQYDGNMVWNEYYLPEEIEAPYGCVLALSSNDNMEVLMDSGNDEGYPKAYRNCMSFDYRDGISLAGRDIIGNFFIRLLGSPLGVPQLAPGMNTSNNMKCFNSPDGTMEKAPATGEVSYKVWRFEIENKENKEEWTSLELSDQKGLNYLDRAYNYLPKGVYQYAIQVIYGDGQESEIGYSNELERKMYANATFPVITNIGVSYAEGAVATLIDTEDENTTYTTIVSDGRAVFEHIKKGHYYLNISQFGFKDKLTEVLDLSSDDNYMSRETFNLVLDNRNPFNLKTEQKDGSLDVTFSWNTEYGIYEDFESMEDFTINPAGNLGWTYVDGDKTATVGVLLCKETPFPNMYAKMAYMSFNPSKTTPDLLDYLKPHSGDKVLAGIATEEGPNDDYLFSPELSFTTDFTLSFYAKSGFFALNGNEEFMVGYCKTSATTDDVTWITTKPQHVGAAWTEFTYDIPKEAKYITIRYVSDQKFFFLLDDIFIGYKKSLVDDIANYNVYLDDEFVGKTGHSEITFPNLTKGKHIAKVQSVYTLMSDDQKAYSEFVEHVFTVTVVSGIEEQAVESLYTYDSNGLITFNDASEVIAYNAQGQLVGTIKEAQINTSNWESGLYIFKVKVNNVISHHKILVK